MRVCANGSSLSQLMLIGFGGIGIGFNLLVLWLLVFIICTTLLHSTLLHSTLLANTSLTFTLLYFAYLCFLSPVLSFTVYFSLFTFVFFLRLFFCHRCHLTSYTSLGLSSFCQVFVTYLHTLQHCSLYLDISVPLLLLPLLHLFWKHKQPFESFGVWDTW